MQAREWFRRRVAAAGLEFFVDGAANMHARLGWDESQVSVMVGSHIDTVPGGGELDGALGVLAGLEALRRVKETGAPLKRPLEVVAFTDEEGAFGGMLGSQALSGQLDPSVIPALRNRDGELLTERMRACGFDPDGIATARRAAGSIAAYIELHIEQGPVLERIGKRIGVVDGIAGQLRWRVTLEGAINHAGTTPMHLRRDAFAGLAEVASGVDAVLARAGGAASVATIGEVKLKPNVSNVVPGTAEFSLDIRDVDNEVLARLGQGFKTLIEDVASRRDLRVTVHERDYHVGVRSAESITEAIHRAATTLGVDAVDMPSGAVHDAQSMAAVTKAGMIFIPSIGGVSHHASERSSDDDIVLGANVLLRVLFELAS